MRLTALALLGVASAFAAGLSDRDQNFVRDAGQAGLAEVKVSRLALERTRNEDVKRFAQMMVDDHTKANAELKKIAERKGVALPDEPNAAQKATFEQLEKMKGDDFDRTFAKTMVSDHELVVQNFRSCGVKCEDEDLKRFATKTLPILEHHLAGAQELRRKVAGDGGPSESKP